MPRFFTEMDWVLGIRSDGLTVFVKALTELGGTWFAVLFLGVGYVFWRRDIAARLIVLSVVSKILNAHLKAAYALPRPDSVYHLIPVSEWTFPSGHAQHAATMWWWLALELGNPWAWVSSTIITLGISLSRVYLGVHYLRDVAAGVLMGLLMVVFFSSLVKTANFEGRLRFLYAQVGLLILIQAFWWVSLPGRGYLFLPATLVIGFWGGLLIQERWAPRWSRPGRVVGTVIVLTFGAIPIFTRGALWWGPIGLGTHPVSAYLQFYLLGVWGGLMGEAPSSQPVTRTTP